MKLLNNLIVPAFCGLLIFSGCSDNPEDPGTQPPSTNPEPPAYLGGYADPDGVLILNQGAAIENSSLTYITPEGNIEQNVYQKVNGSAFGHGGQDLYMHNGKLYILSTNKDVYQKHEGDGTLVIADAVTLKREKAFKFDELKYPRPEGSLDENEFLPLVTPLRNIVVIDEKNIFFSDQKALFRFDSTTGELNIVEDSYHSVIREIQLKLLPALKVWLSLATIYIPVEEDSGPVQDCWSLKKEKTRQPVSCQISKENSSVVYARQESVKS